MGKFKDLVGDNDCNPLVIRVKSEYRSLPVQLVPEYFDAGHMYCPVKQRCLRVCRKTSSRNCDKTYGRKE